MNKFLTVFLIQVFPALPPTSAASNPFVLSHTAPSFLCSTRPVLLKSTTELADFRLQPGPELADFWLQSRPELADSWLQLLQVVTSSPPVFFYAFLRVAVHVLTLPSVGLPRWQFKFV